MFFFNTSYLIYLLFIMSVVFGVFYIWRRIYGLECYSKILEKKITNLKKENKELQEMLNGSCKTSFEDADIIMNKIFNVEYDNKVNSESSQTTIHDVQEATVSADPEITIQNIIGLETDISVNNVNSLPVVEHNETTEKPISNIEKDHEIESVISDTIGVYNRKKLSKMNLDKLKEICVSMNLSTEGTKNNLIDRIVA